MMRYRHFIFLFFIWLLLFSFCSKSISMNESVEEILQIARKQFYDAVEDKAMIEPAMELFRKIGKSEPKYAGRTQVYIGALVVLKGKHAFFPYTKLKWTKRGLTMMDNGLKNSPNDIEALFIHGTTCYHLPFFFRRGDDAQRNFKKIIKMLPQQMKIYDPTLIKNVSVFLLKNAKLTDDQKKYLRTLINKLQP